MKPVRLQRAAVQQGFTLVEVLVAMFVLLIGLLGVVGMHLSGFQNSRDAFYRSQATMIAEDLIDRVRGNPEALALGSYDGVSFANGSSKPSAVSCVAGCTAQEVATRDLREWARHFVAALATDNEYIPTLPGATGTGTSIAGGSGTACGDRTQYDVVVSWNDANGTGSVEISACLVAG